MVAESTEMSSLAKLLRLNGHDDVLNGTSKLSLSMGLLSALNKAKLADVVADGRVENRHEWTNHYDAMRLHDMVQRVHGLKLVRRANGSTAAAAAAADEDDVHASIGQFKSLKTLEVHNVAVECIDGIDQVARQLQLLLCTRCLPRGERSAQTLLQHRDADTGALLQWHHLKEATFTYNRLRSLKHFGVMANLHSLDVSRNDLSDVSDALNGLPNLKHVNLAYNQLRSAPHFNAPLCHRIQVLVLACNFVDDLSAIAVLTNLRDLDVRENCLVEHTSLAPIVNVATLQSLHLNENPISHHPQHRVRSVRHLHANTASVRFVLDGKTLSKSEKRYVGSLHPRARIRSGSTRSRCGDAVHNNSEKPPRSRIRHVSIINDNDDGDDDDDADDGGGGEFAASQHSYYPIVRALDVDGIETSMNHLDTKRQIEELKDQYGNEWLKSQAGSVVQSVLGIGSASMACEAEQTHVFHEPATDADDERHEEQHVQTSPVMMQGHSPHHNEGEGEEEEVAEGEESIFLGTILGEEDPVFIVVTSAHILERDCSSVKEKMRWPTNALTACENDERTLTMHFDTLKKHAKCRTYLWDDEESPRLLQALRMIIADQPAKALNLSVFKCLKCCTQFTLEIVKTVFDEQAKQCPTCASDLVFEDEE